MAANLFAHEAAYRGRDYLHKLGMTQICICGVGALGSQLADALSRIGMENLTLIDKDRVEESNIASQVWQLREVGQLKSVAMQSRLLRNNGIEVVEFHHELTAANAKKMIGDDFVIDTFDNSKSRQVIQQYCRHRGNDCLHIGLSGDGFASVEWDDRYRIPKDTGDDPCDVPLSRTLSMLSVAVATEEILDFCLADEPRKASWSITLRDLQIRRM